MAKERRPSAVKSGPRRTEAPLHLQVGEVDDPTFVLRLFVGNRFAPAEPGSEEVFAWSHDSSAVECSVIE